jgi:hypothetical protein
MEPLFRIMLVRPAVGAEKPAPKVRMGTATPLTRAYADARRNRGQQLKDAARRFEKTPAMVRDAAELPGHDALRALDQALRRLVGGRRAAVNNAAVAEAIQAATGSAPGDIVQSEQYREHRNRLVDSILAIKLLPELHKLDLQSLVQSLRLLDLIRRASEDQGFPASAAHLRAALRAAVQLPSDQPARSPVERRPPRDDGDADLRRKEVEQLVARVGRLNRTIAELQAVPPGAFRSEPPAGGAAWFPPAALRPIRLAERSLARLEIADKLGDILAARPATAGGGEPGRPAGGLPTGFLTQNVSDAVSATPQPSTVRLFAGSPQVAPVSQDLGFRLTDEAAARLSDETRVTLEEARLSSTRHELDYVVAKLTAARAEMVTQLQGLDEDSFRYSFKRVGDLLVKITTPVASAVNWIAVGALEQSLPVYVPQDGRVPYTHGDVTPAGIADLLIIRQQLVGYEAADVAHIENVLLGERQVREHRRRRVTEEFLLRETETTTSEERDLESTDRFEMRRETAETIKEEAALKAGLTVSGKYGPVVEFSASVEGSLDRSREQSTKTASEFSKEVTQRSAAKITERVLRQETLRVTNEVEDKTEHTLDNVQGQGHVVGVYQWVQKVYEAQMFNYGARTMFDFMLPEPGAFLVEAFRRAHANALEIEKPPAFRLQPNQIHESNYAYWVRRLEAKGVKAPPEPNLTKSFIYSAPAAEKGVDLANAAEIPIDAGYEAVYGHVGRAINVWEGESWSVDVVLGHRSHRMTNGSSSVWSTQLDGQTGSIPFAVNTLNVAAAAFAVEVKCRRTARALNTWRLETHQALLEAHQAKVAAYEEAMARAKAEAGVVIPGRPPSINLELMKDELKKACVTVMTEQHFDLFAAVQAGANGFPQVDLFENEAEGPYVRFFEQAFEWEHMTWVTYPYFWGRKLQWTDRIAFEDPDPMFNQFLKAGYCRVSVPVRLGFEGAIDHFTTTGETWMGGPLPTVSSDLFLPIAEELAEQLDRPGDEVPVGDPWEVRIPTTLVRLRPDGSLPSWVKQADGSWVGQ